MKERAAIGSIAALCSVSFLQAYLLVGVFPYAAYLSIYFLKIPAEQAGPYAASFATSFMIGRTVTAHLWGLMADIYGRRFVMILSLVGSGLASLWFGLTDSYSEAIIARGMIGAWNSIVGVSKTVATELAYFDYDNKNREADADDHEDSVLLDNEHVMQKQQLETRIVGRVMSMRAFGFLFAPGVAGFLAGSDPLGIREKGVAADSTIEGSSVFFVSCYNLLSRYPYLLPNVLGAVMCWVSAIAVYFCIPETMTQCRSARLLFKDALQWVKRKCAKRQSSEREIQESSSISLDEVDNALSNNSLVNQYGSMQNDSKSDTKESTSLTLIWSRRKTRNHLVAYWLYSVFTINIDEAFPLYCISRNTGIGGLQEQEIGKILSGSGILFAVGQFKVYTWICDRFGVYGSLDLGCWFGVLPVALFPLASLVCTANKRWSMLYLAILSGITKIFQSAFFSSITVTTNRTVPAEMRSRMNALGSIGAGLSKAIGPLFVGLWMAFCLSLDAQHGTKRLPIGSVLAWLGISLVSGLSMFAILRTL